MTGRGPFRFFSRLSLTLATGMKAANLRELAEGIITSPPSVIYHHTHRFLQQHQYLVPEPPNDFAYWVTHMLGEESLGERLAAVDTVRYNSLEDLRKALLEALRDGLTRPAAGRAAPEGKEFHFLSAQRFSVPTPHEARTLAEFAEGLKKVSVSSLYLHIFEARLRPPLGRNDFSLWFEQELGETELARRVEDLDPYTHTLEGLRAKILGFLDERMSRAAP